MGHQTSSVQFPKENWVEFKKDGNTMVYHNGKGSYAEKKSLTQDKRLSAQEELMIYKERSETKLPIVKVHSVQLTQEKRDFCSIMQKMLVWIEYIPNRLTFVKGFTLSEVECLYILQQSLTAFYELFKKFGFFQINSDMIGFSIQGEVKCWLNKYFQSNMIQNSNDSVISSGEGSSIRNTGQMDKRLKDNIEKNMVNDLWQIIKKKSNIESRDLYNKLSNLENINFQSSLKLVEYLVFKSKAPIPSCLIFENCLDFNKKRFTEYSYGNSYDEEKPVTKAVQTYDVELVRNGILNCNFWAEELNFRDFDTYREHIDSLRPRKANSFSDHMNISFDILPRFESIPRFDTRSSENPEANTEKKIPKSPLKLVDKTIDISLSSPQNSNKTLPDHHNDHVNKKFDSQDNLFLPISSNMKTAYSILIPNATSERQIINKAVIFQSPRSPKSPTLQVPGVPLMRSVKVNCPIEKNLIAEHKEPISLENYPLLYRKSSARMASPSPVPVPVPVPKIVVRQPAGYPSNEPTTPQFNKQSFHFTEQKFL